MEFDELPSRETRADRSRRDWKEAAGSEPKWLWGLFATIFMAIIGLGGLAFFAILVIKGLMWLWAH